MPRHRTGSAFLYCRVSLENPTSEPDDPHVSSFRTTVSPTTQTGTSGCLLPFRGQFDYFIEDCSKPVSEGIYDIIATVCHHRFSLSTRLHLTQTYLKDVGVNDVPCYNVPGDTASDEHASGFPYVELRGNIVSVRSNRGFTAFSHLSEHLVHTGIFWGSPFPTR